MTSIAQTSPRGFVSRQVTVVRQQETQFDGVLVFALAIGLLIAWNFWMRYWALYPFIVLGPAIPYLALSLSYRRIISRKIAEVDSRLTQDLKVLYANVHGTLSVRHSLKQFYHWTTYLAPVALTSAVAMIFSAIGAGKLGLITDPTIESARIIDATTYPVLAGALGAYLWGLADVVRRHGTADLSSTSLHYTWLRMVIGAGVGIVIGKFNETWGAAVAFVLPTLRIDDIWNFLREKAGVASNDGPAWQPDLYLLEGLTVPARDRLIAEDIDSVQRLAYSDPVRLLFRTNIEWNVILDLTDQALLINYVGDKIISLREIGIRGAIEFQELYVRLQNPSPYDDPPTAEEMKNAQDMLAVVANRIGFDPPAAFNLAYQLANDPLVEFVWENYASVYDDKAVAEIIARN